MSRSSVTLKNVMGGCELIDLRPPILEKSWLIDLSLIGVDLQELQKNLISELSPNQNNTKEKSVHLASITEYEFGGENCVFESKDNSDDYSDVVRQIDEEVLKSSARLEPVNVQCELEMFDNMNTIKVVDSAKQTDLSPPVFTSLQNFYETFDVSDQSETMTVMGSIAGTPSSVSTFDSSFEQDLVIHKPINSSVYYDNFEVASDVPSPSTANQNELYFIPNSVYSHQDLTHLLLLQKIANRALGTVDKSDEKSETKEKKRKPGRVSRKPIVEKNVSCSRCSRKFRTEAHLKAHFKVHMDSAEYLYSCMVCDRRFCHRGALALHARRHTSRSEFCTPY